MNTRLFNFAVIGSDGVHLHSGQRMSLGSHNTLADWLGAMERRGIDALWLHPSAGWQWGDADIETARAVGWQINGGGDVAADEGAPWWVASHYGGNWRHIVQPNWEDRTHAPWRDIPSAAMLRDALLSFRDATGIDWRRSPGSTGTALIRESHRDPRATKLEYDGPPPSAATLQGALVDAGHISWTRPLAPTDGKYIHAFDVNGQYLAACSSLPLGVGRWYLQKSPALPEKPSQWHPGYYRIRAIEKAKKGLPSVVGTERASWVTLPSLRLLNESGATFEVLECCVWTESVRYLEPWYKRLRDARAKLMTDRTPPAAFALDALKGVYAAGLGWLGSGQWDRTGDVLYRPDWMHQGRSLARANVLRTVYRVAQNYQIAPLAVGSDCIYYTGDEANPLALPFLAENGLRFSDQLGHYKIKRPDTLPDGWTVETSGVPVASVAHILKAKNWSLARLQTALKHQHDKAVA